MSDGALSRALQQRAVFHEFGLESGQALFALFFWTSDNRQAAAAACPGATSWQEPNDGHSFPAQNRMDDLHSNDS